MFDMKHEMMELNNTLDALISKTKEESNCSSMEEVRILENKFKSMAIMLLVKDPAKWCLMERTKYVSNVQSKFKVLYNSLH